MAADLNDPDYWETSIRRSSGRLFMLVALVDRPRHGYEIARRIRELCGGWCTPSDAMIYPAIRDLESAGLIVRKRESRGSRVRFVCSLTERGRDALRASAQVWARYLPALGRVVAAAQLDAGVPELPLGPGCCPACCQPDEGRPAKL